MYCVVYCDFRRTLVADFLSSPSTHLSREALLFVVVGLVLGIDLSVLVSQ